VARYRIAEYVTLGGVRPFRDWLVRLRDMRGRTKVVQRVERAEAGNLGIHHGVGDGVLEMIIDWGPGYRVYFGKSGPDELLLLAGGSKRTQRQDIDTSKRYWSDYVERRCATRGWS